MYVNAPHFAHLPLSNFAVPIDCTSYWTAGVPEKGGSCHCKSADLARVFTAMGGSGAGGNEGAATRVVYCFAHFEDDSHCGVCETRASGIFCFRSTLYLAKSLMACCRAFRISLAWSCFSLASSAFFLCVALLSFGGSLIDCNVEVESSS